MKKKTRWWWIRHAPVIKTQGFVYGSSDVACDTSNYGHYRGLNAVLPQDAIWVTSHLSRARHTAQAIIDTGFSVEKIYREENLGEQSFGCWEGIERWEDLLTSSDQESRLFFEDPIYNSPPNGETFSALVARVRKVIEAYTQKYSGSDIIAVAHGGTIRAALSIALGDLPHGIQFVIDNNSLTRIAYVHEGYWIGKVTGKWEINQVNWLPGKNV